MNAPSQARGQVFVTATVGADHQRLTAIRDLDVATEDLARLELHAAVSTARGRLEVDASGVFVDLRGLDALLEAAERARAHGLQLTIVPATSLSRISSILHLEDQLVLQPRRSSHLDVPHAR